MSTFVRAKSRRQLRHPASRSESHLQDKLEGERRQRVGWLAIPSGERQGPVRSFEGLEGHEVILRESGWRRCEGPEEFADFLERSAAERDFYQDATSRHGRPEVVVRRVERPVEVITTTFEPALAELVASRLASGRDPRPQLGELRNIWLERVIPAFSEERHLLGYAFHCDSRACPHLDLCMSRQDGRGGRVGRAGLRLMGPWCVAVDRQLRVGAEISLKKRAQFRRSVENFRRRYGPDAVPLDFFLARTLDAAAEEAFGAELLEFRECYARSVPELEHRNLEARVAALDAAKQELLSIHPVKDNREMNDEGDTDERFA